MTDDSDGDENEDEFAVAYRDEESEEDDESDEDDEQANESAVYCDDTE